ncbi:MAG: GNAT family N-acetyltransferase [Lachnospiraceae bacterium]|nr:GNAT family N-acetyltransferase [Lachnospiraceae bacterium]
MKLQRLISLNCETEGILQKYKDSFEVLEFTSKEDFYQYLQLYKELCILQKNNLYQKIETLELLEKTAFKTIKNSLLIASTTETIAFAKEVGIAVLAYANPNLPQQDFWGVEMVVEGFEEVEADFLEKAFQRFHNLPWTIAETKRCIIRELSLEDMDGLFELYSHKELTRYTEKLFPYEQEKEYQSAYIQNMYRYFGYGMWLIFLKETKELIGRAGLEHREYHGEAELELGYLIAPKFQKQGFATEVCTEILNYAKQEVYFSHINCLIEKDNIASIALAEKLGFTFVEEMEEKGKQMLRFKRIL